MSRSRQRPAQGVGQHADAKLAAVASARRTCQDRAILRPRFPTAPGSPLACGREWRSLPAKRRWPRRILPRCAPRRRAGELRHHLQRPEQSPVGFPGRAACAREPLPQRLPGGRRRAPGSAACCATDGYASSTPSRATSNPRSARHDLPSATRMTASGVCRRPETPRADTPPAPPRPRRAIARRPGAAESAWSSTSRRSIQAIEALISSGLAAASPSPAECGNRIRAKGMTDPKSPPRAWLICCILGPGGASRLTSKCWASAWRKGA